MKTKTLFLFLLGLFAFSFAQQTANRFFYELSYQPKKDSSQIKKVITVLDITPDKSYYRDYTIISQDSILKVVAERMKSSGMFQDVTKIIKKPVFTSAITKTLPKMDLVYSERIVNGGTPLKIGYEQMPNFAWKITGEMQKIGGYDTQKATVEFGGREWTAWFCPGIPFSDGPYKFSGLPGLIVKIEDSDKNYSWELKGNKKVEDFQDISFADKLSGGTSHVTIIDKDRFEKKMQEYKKDPMASTRPLMSDQIMASKIPGSDKTIGDMFKSQEKYLKEIYNSNDNPIERKLFVGKPEQSKEE